MPYTMREILEQADDLAKQFEEYEPKPGDRRDARALRDVAKARLTVSRAESDLVDAVVIARAEGHSWTMIGLMLGVSGKQAEERFSPPDAP